MSNVLARLKNANVLVDAVHRAHWLQETIDLAAEELTAARAEGERLRRDAGILLANLDYLQEEGGEYLETEDAAVVEQIRAALTGASEKEDTAMNHLEFRSIQ